MLRPLKLTFVFLTALFLVLLFLLISANLGYALRMQENGQVNSDETIYSIEESHSSILLWPKSYTTSSSDIAPWLIRYEDSPYLIRDNLLISVKSLAQRLPREVTIHTLEPESDLISVSAPTPYLSAIMERLYDHPLLEKITADNEDMRKLGRIRWSHIVGGASENAKDFLLIGHIYGAVNIRSKNDANVVWGYIQPNRKVHITLRRKSFLRKVESTSDENGFYIAYFDWDIKLNDVVSLSYDDVRITTKVPPIPIKRLRLHQFSLDVQNQEDVYLPNSEYHYGFVRRRINNVVSIFTPLAQPVVHIRADTSTGWPYFHHTHSFPVNSRVWGHGAPNEDLVVILKKPNTPPIIRPTKTDGIGLFAVSMDIPIDDGDTVIVGNGTITKTILVPKITYQVDNVQRIITGVGPKNIDNTAWNAPHTMRVEIAWKHQPVQTDSDGRFTADFSDRNYLAGQLGAITYITPEGDFIHKPVWAVDPLIRGKAGDWVADVILGQPDFSEIVPNEVQANKLFNPGGVYIDRSVTPNRVYVYDSGNSRILGLNHLGVCAGGSKAGTECTVDSECPGSFCRIDMSRNADIVLGQPSFNTSACNGDSGFQNYPDAHLPSASTLCGLREQQLSVEEGGSGATMKTDAHGNLFVPDFFNNRVLLFRDPFTTDTIADGVWGQFDFSGMACNHGSPWLAFPDSLCLAPPPGPNELAAGVDIDSQGNLWIADNENNRVLRFPFDPVLGMPAHTADLVLGQPDFTTRSSGTSSREMNHPQSVRISPNGEVYVADSRNQRILVFSPPFSIGMEAT